MKKFMISAVAALAIVSGSNANAGGEEIAAGVGGLILGKIIWDTPDYRPSYPGYSVYSSTGFYSNLSGRWYPWDRQFPRFRCRGDAVKCSYEMGVYERERQAFNEAKVKAYECGRWGRCEQETE